MTARRAWGLWLGLIGGLLCWLSVLFPHTHWSSSLTAAFPQERGQWQQQLLSTNSANRQFRLVLTGLSAAELDQVTSELMAANHHTDTLWSWLKPSDNLSAMTEFSQHSSGRIASNEAQKYLENGQFKPLIDAAWQRLLSPLPLPEAIIQHDPLLLAQQHLEQLLQSSGQGIGLQPKDYGYTGNFEQKAFVLLQAELQFDPFDSSRTQQVLAELSPQLMQLQQKYPGLQLIRSGVLFHAAIASSQAQHEMTWYGGFSLLAITILIIAVFRSIYPLLLASLLLGTGVLVGLVAVLMCFDSPHLIAFVFATTLIGIAIDYAFHGMLAVQQGRDFFRRMLPGLQLSLMTTLIGYMVLFALPLAILNQVAVFMMAGLSVVYALVHWILPAVLPTCHVSSSATQLATKYLTLWQRLSARHSQIILVSVPIVILSVLVTVLRVDDDVRTLNTMDQTLVKQEHQIQQMTGMRWDMRFILVQAENLDELLNREQQVVQLLAAWQQQGKLNDWQALSDWIWSLAQQQELQRQLQVAYQEPAVRDYIEQLGVELVAPDLKQMNLQQLPAGLQLLAVTPNIADAPAVVGVIPVQGWQLDDSHLEQLRNIGLVDVYNPVEDASNRLQAVRLHLQHGLAIAALCVLAFMCWHFGWKRAIAVALYLCICGSLAMLGPLLLGHALNLFHVVGLVLVLALTMDYAIFFSSNLAGPEVQLAVGMSAFTSMLAFGVLIFSQTPVIAGFGLTILCGISAALLFAPILRTTKLEDGAP